MVDQFFWAEQINKFKLGPKPLDFKKLFVSTLSEKINELAAANEYRENAKKLSAELNKEDGIKKAVDIIEQFIDKPQFK